MKVGFLGLGNMGGGMARNLLDKGYELIVFDANSRARDAFACECAAAPSAGDVLTGAEVVFLSLPGSREVDSTVDAFLRAGVQGKYIVDCSTSYPLASIRNNARISAAGGFFLEAPVMGTPGTARSGHLRMLAAGEREVFDTLKPVLVEMCDRLFYAGASGCGDMVKLSANFLTMSYTALYAELLPMLEAMGADYGAFYEAISGGAADCGMFQTVVPKLHARDHKVTFSTKNAMKDVSYTKELYADKGYPSPMLDACLQVFTMAKCMGYYEEDYTRVAEVMRFFIHPKPEENDGKGVTHEDLSR